MKDFVVALDQGTTSSRALVFDRQGKIVAQAQQEFPQLFPHAGWVEHDPAEIWSTQLKVANEAVCKAGLAASDLAAVGITNQRETTILWDRKTGHPVYNAIVWQDRRTSDQCQRLKSAQLEPTFLQKTGLLIDPYFAGTKIQWILDNVDGVRQRAERGQLAFGTVDSWLAWNLLQGTRHVTDASNAVRTLLFNIHTGEWDDELLARLNIPRSLLPTVASSSEVYGEVQIDCTFQGVPIGGMAGDQSAALFGQSCFQPGMAKNTYGTGCFLLMNTGDQAEASRNRLLTTIAWKLDGAMQYALEGSIFVGGAVVQWLRDGLGILKQSSDVEALAASVSDAGGIFLVPAFAGLGAPYWDPYARGTMVGMTRGTTAAHIARAAVESIAYQSYDVLQAMERDAGIRLHELRVDGGACANDALMQFQADLLQVPVVRPTVTETTALGAAYLAGLAVGFWRGRGEIAGQWSVDKQFEPQRSQAEMAAHHAGWQRAVERAGGWQIPDPSAAS